MVKEQEIEISQRGLEEPINHINIEEYLSRVLAQINQVGREMDAASKTNDLKRKTDLLEVKVGLAEELFKLRARRVIGKKEIKVTYLTALNQPQMDLIEVNFPVFGRRPGFHLTPPRYYPFSSQVERLIEEGGGYDARKSRPRHQVSRRRRQVSLK